MARAFDDAEATRVRARLLEAGRASVARVGFRRTRVEDVAKEAGVAKGTFYRFFERKEDLLIAVLREGEAALREELAAAGTLREALWTLFSGVESHPLLAALADPDDFRWLVGAVEPGALEEAGLDDDRWFGAWLVDLQGRGLVRDDVDVQAFLGLPVLALGAAWSASLGPPERRRAALGLVVDGLVGELSPRSPPGGR